MDAKTEELLLASRSLLDASIEDYGEPDEWPDDESVAAGKDHESAVKFGHIRRLREAIARFDKQ